MSELGLAPMFYRVVVPPGRVALVRAHPATPWPEHLGISDVLLDVVDPEFVSSGDGMVRFSLADDDALYGFAHDAPEPGIGHYDRIDV